MPVLIPLDKPAAETLTSWQLRIVANEIQPQVQTT